MELNKSELTRLIAILRERLEFERGHREREPLAGLITGVQIPKALSEGLAKLFLLEGPLPQLRGFDIANWGEGASDLYALRTGETIRVVNGFELRQDDLKSIEVKGSRSGWVSYTQKDANSWRVIWIDFAHWATSSDPILPVYELCEPRRYKGPRTPHSSTGDQRAHDTVACS